MVQLVCSYGTEGYGMLGVPVQHTWPWSGPCMVHQLWSGRATGLHELVCLHKLMCGVPQIQLNDKATQDDKDMLATLEQLVAAVQVACFSKL